MARDSLDDDDLERDLPSAETPLLGSAGERGGDYSDGYDPGVLYRQNVIILSLAMVLLLSLGSQLLIPPTTAIMESIICREYHPDVVGGGLIVTAPVCKHPDVQARLAEIRGWASTFDCIPGILVGIPWGMMSDKWGRRPVMALSVGGFSLSILHIITVLWLSNILPLWTIWLGSLFLFIGGSISVAVAMLYTMVADVVPVAERATVFLQLMAAQLVSNMVAGPLAGVLMRRSPWIPTLTGFLLIVLSVFTSLIYPETLELKKLRSDLRAANGEVDDADPVAATGEPDIHAAKKMTAKMLDNLLEMWTFVVGNRRIMFLLISIMFFAVARFVQEMLLQYASKRFGWTWDEAAILLTVHGAANLVTLMVILPAASWVCLNYLKMSALSKDLWLARVTGTLLSLGALLIGISVNGHVLMFALVVFAAGGGFPSLLRSLMNALVEEGHVGTLNTLVSFLETIGLMIAGPTLSEALGYGIERGGAWIGLPFLCAAGLIFLSTVIVLAFRLPGPRGSV